jgi:excisionase family DNA binding protein
MKAMSIPEFAARLGVHRATAYRLIAAGAVTVTDVSASGKKPRLRITEAAYERFLSKREIKGRAA